MLASRSKLSNLERVLGGGGRMRSDSEIRDKRADAIAQQESATTLDGAADQVVHDWAQSNGHYFDGVISTFNWGLGEGTSPVHGYDDFSDALYFDELRAVRRVVEDGQPAPAHLSLNEVMGIMRGLMWMRSTSDRFVSDPCVYA
jgi:hypothetical protein